MPLEMTEWTPPRTVVLFSEAVPPNGGQCWPVATCDEEGMPHETGGTMKRAPLAWGESGGAPADAPWVEVTDLGDLEGSLWAVLVDGVLYLHIGTAAPDAGGLQQVESGSGFIARTNEECMRDGQGTGRHPGPSAYLCPKDARLYFLKSGDKWRADLSWDILCTAYYRTSNTHSHSELPSRVLTVWMVVSGNVIAFYTTVGDFHTAEGGHVYSPRNWAAFGSVTRCYGHDPRDEYDGVDSNTGQLTFGNVAPVVWGAYADLQPFMHVAPLPWQADGGEALFEGDEGSEAVNCGTMNSTLTDDGGQFPCGQSSFLADGGIYVCPRLHFGGGLSSYSGGVAFSKAQVEAILYGDAADFPTYTPDPTHYNIEMFGPQDVWIRIVPGCNLLFDPWGVEGLGLHELNDNGAFARKDAPHWLPPVATDWKRLAAATLRGPAGDLYLDIAGAEMDGCLLTASGSTENLT